MNWRELTIAIVGGDRREQEIARCAASTGAAVKAYGFPWPAECIPNVSLETSAEACLRDADFALFPVPGSAPDGALFAPKCPERIIPNAAALGRMRNPAHIILGWADKNLKAHCEALAIGIHEYEWDEDLMLLRGQAIVEGMLKIIIENTDITIHKSNICQVGQGTIGSLATRTLYSLGARVHVVARNPVQRAAAYAAGADVYPLEELSKLLPQTDILVSSVPAQLVSRDHLRLVPKHALLVDLAAPPGGIDREAAAELGLKFVWARGLGSRAPVTVGRSQWIGIRKRIESLSQARS
jgi:dipicolinate synthase subunit A